MNAPEYESDTKNDDYNTHAHGDANGKRIPKNIEYDFVSTPIKESMKAVLNNNNNNNNNNTNNMHTPPNVLKFEVSPSNKVHNSVGNNENTATANNQNEQLTIGTEMAGLGLDDNLDNHNEQKIAQRTLGSVGSNMHEELLLPPLPNGTVPIEYPIHAGFILNAESNGLDTNTVSSATAATKRHNIDNNEMDDYYGSVIINDYYESSTKGDSNDHLESHEVGATNKVSDVSEDGTSRPILNASQSMPAELETDSLHNLNEKRQSLVSRSLSGSRVALKQQHTNNSVNHTDYISSTNSPALSPRLSVSKRTSHHLSLNSPNNSNSNFMNNSLTHNINANSHIQRSHSVRSNISYALSVAGTPLTHNGDVQSATTRSSSAVNKNTHINENGVLSNDDHNRSHNSIANTTIDIPNAWELFDDQSITLEHQISSFQQPDEYQANFAKPKGKLIRKASSALLRKASGLGQRKTSLSRKNSQKKTANCNANDNILASPTSPFVPFTAHHDYSQTGDQNKLETFLSPNKTFNEPPSCISSELPLTSSPLSASFNGREQQDHTETLRKQKSFSNKLKNRFNRMLSSSTSHLQNTLPSPATVSELQHEFLPTPTSETTTSFSSSEFSWKHDATNGLSQPVYVSRKSSVLCDKNANNGYHGNMSSSNTNFQGPTSLKHGKNNLNKRAGAESNASNTASASIPQLENSHENTFISNHGSPMLNNSDPDQNIFSEIKKPGLPQRSSSLKKLRSLKKTPFIKGDNASSHSVSECSETPVDTHSTVSASSKKNSNTNNKLAELEKSLAKRVSSLSISTLKRSSSYKRNASPAPTALKKLGRSISQPSQLQQFRNTSLPKNSNHSATKDKSTVFFSKHKPKSISSTDHYCHNGQGNYESRLTDLSYTFPDPNLNVPWDESILSSIAVDIHDLISKTPSIVISDFDKEHDFTELDFLTDSKNNHHLREKRKLNYNNKYLEKNVNIGRESKLSYDKFYQRVLSNQIILPEVHVSNAMAQGQTVEMLQGTEQNINTQINTGEHELNSKVVQTENSVAVSLSTTKSLPSCHSSSLSSDQKLSSTLPSSTTLSPNAHAAGAHNGTNEDDASSSSNVQFAASPLPAAPAASQIKPTVKTRKEDFILPSLTENLPKQEVSSLEVIEDTKNFSTVTNTSNNTPLTTPLTTTSFAQSNKQKANPNASDASIVYDHPANGTLQKMSLKEYIALLSELQRVEDSNFNALEQSFINNGWTSKQEILALKQKRMLVNKRWAERISFYQSKL
ncbi:hypothetical protein ACO0QE_000195 [Hanseniaspora vineae]